MPIDALPAFPTNVLPDVLRNWVEGESHATQTPVDLAAWGAIAACSSRLARRVIVRPRHGWDEPTNIYSAVLLGPGNRKSAVFANALRPLRQIEKELIEAARPEVAKLKSRRRQAEARLKKLEQQLAGNDDPEVRHEADQIAEDLAREIEAALPQLLVDDATSESTAKICFEQGGRIMSATPEGGVFDLMAGKYSKSNSADFDIYLKGHAGDDYRANRISREAVCIERTTITAFYAMQPEVLLGIAGNTAFRGRGLLARFLYAAPTSPVGKRAIGAEPISPKAVEEYHHLVREIGEFNGDQVLTLKEPAKFLEWESEIEHMLADGGEMEFIRDWGAKLAGATLRIAAVLHAAEKGAHGQITNTTIQGAIKIARYLIPHAKYVLCEMAGGEFGNQEEIEQRELIAWIKSQGGEASIREVTRGLRRFRGKVVEAEHALKALATDGMGTWEINQTATNMKRVFRLAPAATATHFPESTEIRESVTVASVTTPIYETNGHDPEEEMF